MHLLTVFWEENKLIVICIKHTMNMVWIKQQEQNNISEYAVSVFIGGTVFIIFALITSVTACVLFSPYSCFSLAQFLIRKTNMVYMICTSTQSLALC